jgi:methionine-rich copper-binding protein CopC
MKRLLAVLALTGLGLFALAAPASAHNSLISSTPSNQSSLDAGPQTVVLTFDQPVQEGEGLNSVAVTGPDGTQWQGGPATVDSNVVSAPVRALGPAGVYTVGYRIVSADGHPVSGKVTFTLTKPGTGTPAKVTKDSASVPGTTSGDSNDGVPIGVWLIGAGLLLGAGLFFAMRIGGKQE